LSLHHLRKVLFVLRPRDRTNGEAILLTYLAWDCRHDGRRWKTTPERLASRTGFQLDTIKVAMRKFESRRWLTLERDGPRITDWQLTLPDTLTLDGDVCGKPCGKPVHPLRISPPLSRTGDRENPDAGSPIADPASEETLASDTAGSGWTSLPSLIRLLIRPTEREELRSAEPLSRKLHSENAGSGPRTPNADTDAALQLLRMAKARIDAEPAPAKRRRTR